MRRSNRRRRERKDENNRICKAELGFIERSTNPKDKRTFDIRPTEKARAAYPHVQEQIENCFGRMTGRMSDSERDEFRRLLLLAAETTLAQDE